ncbi:MAG: FAD-dependent oxidoreductase [Bacteroidota bacterium]
MPTTSAAAHEAAATTSVRVAAVSDLAEGEMKEIEIADTKLLLSNVGGQFHATSAFCTHYGAPLATGVLAGPKVICPWHHAVFDVTDGALDEPPALDALARFETVVKDGEVFVMLPEDEHGVPQIGDGVAPHQGCVTAMTTLDEEADARTFAIVGGGAAGLAAAETLRQVGYQGRVVLVTDADELPIDRTKLSKGYLAGAPRDSLPLRSADFFERYGIEVRTGHRVARLDARAKQIHFANEGDGAHMPLAYDAALIATGGTPRRLGIPGADLDGVFLLRSTDDATQIVEAAEAGQSAVVIGTGFIGMEAAAALVGRGLSVTVVGIESVPFERILGLDVGAVFQRLHEEQGVAFRMSASTEQISATDDGLRLTLGDGTALDADFIVMGVGVTPTTDFMDGLPTDDRGALVADANLQIGPDLYAAGDIASYPEVRLGERVRIEHWRLAQQHGRIAARNMAGQAVPFEAVPYFWSGQLGMNLRYLGHAKSWDEVIIDGSLDDRQFVAYYAKDGRVQAAAGVKRDKVIASLHAHWMTGGTTSVDEVRR